MPQRRGDFSPAYLNKLPNISYLIEIGLKSAFKFIKMGGISCCSSTNGVRIVRLSIFIVVGCFLSSLSFANDCRETMGAIDFGSGTTKFIAADVDRCEKQILQIIHEDRLQISLNEYLEKSNNGEVRLDDLRKYIPQLRKSLQTLQEKGVQRPFAVATSVFRVAKNGLEMARLLKNELKVDVQIISQDQEAELGYYSALAKLKTEQTRMIVWDIGGGSMQMFAKQGNQDHIYRGDLASVTFKNQVLRDLKFADPKVTTSPNPLGRARAAAVQIAKNHAHLNVPLYFKREASSANVIGVGGVLSISVLKQTGNTEAAFDQGDLEKALEWRSKLTDKEINSPYSATDVTNIALVLGYMRALNIQSVQVVDAALGEGLIYKNLQSR